MVYAVHTYTCLRSVVYNYENCLVEVGDDLLFKSYLQVFVDTCGSMIRVHAEFCSLNVSEYFGAF